MKKHLSLEERYIIEESLNEGKSFKSIAKLVNKNCSTISKEVKKNSTSVKPSSFNSVNTCKNRYICDYTNVCKNPLCKSKCSNCYKCTQYCPDYVPNSCEKLDKPPYVCNSCDTKKGCRKIKKVYKGKEANEKYQKLLVDSRKGINLDTQELKEISKIVIPAIKQGHSPAVIVMNNPNLNRSESTIYRDISNGVYEGINDIDLLRKVKMKKRQAKVQTNETKNTKIREGRTYDDMLIYKATHPTARMVQFDTVEGIKGGKCLFTIHFPCCSFMLAYLIDAQQSNLIVQQLDKIKNIWKDKFYIDFEIGLTDNGKEFKLPDEMEYYNEKYKMNLFYCDAGKSYQKPEIENNHTLIRRILPKGSSFDNLTQEDIDLIMNHINSTPREELNGNTPFELASILVGVDIIYQVSKPIPRNDVILKPELLDKKNK